MPTTSPRLLVVVAEPVSAWVAKGEVTDRYLNPGDLFSAVHLLIVGDDKPPRDAVQRMVGTAELSVQNLAAGAQLFARTLGWRPWLLKRWAAAAVDAAREFSPDVVRCYSAHLNAYAALQIRAALGVPYTVSLHINPEVDIYVGRLGWRRRLAAVAEQQMITAALRGADLVLPVYEPIVPYLRRLGVERYEVAYNMINSQMLRTKENYDLHSPVKVISVGRQFSAKNPVNLVRAVRQLSNFELTLVGDGPAHEELRKAADGCERITFRRRMSNDELCGSLSDYDIFATHTDYFEISKSVIEALLSGLPVMLNRRQGPAVPELRDQMCRFVEDTPQGWASGLSQLAEDPERAAFARRAAVVASSRWSPVVTEQRFVDIYSRLIETGRAA